MKFINIFLLSLVFANISFAGPRVGGGGVSYVSSKVGGGGVFFTNPKVGGERGEEGSVRGKVGGGGIGFTGPVVGGGVSIKVGGEGAGESHNNDADFVIPNAMLGKLKKLGVEKLLLENGETVDLSGDVNAY